MHPQVLNQDFIWGCLTLGRDWCEDFAMFSSKNHFSNEMKIEDWKETIRTLWWLNCGKLPIYTSYLWKLVIFHSSLATLQLHHPRDCRQGWLDHWAGWISHGMPLSDIFQDGTDQPAGTWNGRCWRGGGGYTTGAGSTIPKFTRNG